MEISLPFYIQRRKREKKLNRQPEKKNSEEQKWTPFSTFLMPSKSAQQDAAVLLPGDECWLSGSHWKFINSIKHNLTSFWPNETVSKQANSVAWRKETTEKEKVKGGEEKVFGEEQKLTRSEAAFFIKRQLGYGEKGWFKKGESWLCLTAKLSSSYKFFLIFFRKKKPFL